MIYIKFSISKKQFIVSATGNNSEKLSSTELFNSKQAAWKNIAAQARNFSIEDTYNSFEVADLTTKIFTLYRVLVTKKSFSKSKIIIKVCQKF